MFGPLFPDEIALDVLQIGGWMRVSAGLDDVGKRRNY